MSDEVVLPPELPEDASKSDLPPSSNVPESTISKLLENNISSVEADIIDLSNMSPFRAMAVGTVGRANKSSLGLTPADIPGVFWTANTAVADQFPDVVNLIMQYYFSIYQKIVKGETSLPYHPRNVGFILGLLARNRVLSTGGKNVLVLFTPKNPLTITELQMETISAVMRHRQMGYDVVNVPVYESGPFPSSKEDDPKNPVSIIKLDARHVGSVFNVFELLSSGSVIYDYCTDDIPSGAWWVKAACSMWRQDVPRYSTLSQTMSWYNISVHPHMLSMWISYADAVNDTGFVLSTTYPFDIAPIEVNAEGKEQSVYPFNNYWANVASTFNHVDASFDFNTLPFMSAYDVNAQANRVRWIYMLVSAMYAPFGQLTWEVFFNGAYLSNELDTLQRHAVLCLWKRPIWLPSLLHEGIAAIGESTMLKSTNYGVTRNIQYFHVSPWPAIKNAVTTTTITYVNYGNLLLALHNWESMLMARKYLKMNLAPEYKVNKAVMPYFFVHVPLTRPYKTDTGTTDKVFDAIATPYSLKYITEHNLHIFARTLFWPRLWQITPSVLEWFNIVDLVPLDDPQTTSYYTVVDPFLLAVLSVDASYLADGCEVDDYMHKMRTTHLGFFAALAGLLPTAIKAGVSLFKAVTKPSVVDEPPPKDSTANVARAQTVNMAEAGISSLTQVLAGPPGSGGTVDLSKDVQIDPVEQTLELGKKVFRGKKMEKYIDVAGRAVRIGRSFYKHYKNQKSRR